MNTMRTAMLAALGLVVSLTGCNIVLSLDDFGQAEPKAGSGGAGGQTSSSSGAGGQTSSSSGAGGQTSSSSSGAGGQTSSSSSGGGAGGQAPTCDGNRACVGAVPDGWVGPVALYLGDRGTAAPGCIGAYPTDAGEYDGDLAADTSTCECSCGPATGIVCGKTASVCSRSNCTVQACFGTKTSVGACGSYSIPGPNVDVTPPTPSNHGTCAPQQTQNIKPPAWGTTAKACGGATTTPEGCGEGGACAPIPLDPFQRTCVQRAGDVPCSDAFYSEQHVLYNGVNDNRSCADCSCGSATSKCGGGLSFVSSCTDTMPTNYGSIDAGSCGVVPNNGYPSYGPNPSGSCPAVGGDLTGSLTPKGAVTFCCQPVAAP